MLLEFINIRILFFDLKEFIKTLLFVFLCVFVYMLIYILTITFQCYREVILFHSNKSVMLLNLLQIWL